ncbi:putative 14-3-3 protein theta-like [Ilyonectria robusta]
MVTHVNEVAKAGGEFSSEEQKLLSTAYRNVVGSRRASLQIISSIKESELSSEKYITAIQEYRYKILSELEKFYEDILELLDKRLIYNTTIGMSKNSLNHACDLAQQAIDDTIAELYSLSEESFHDSTLVIQLLRDNLLNWTFSDMDELETHLATPKMAEEA